MNSGILVILFQTLALLGAAEDGAQTKLTDPVEILKRADVAAKHVGAIKYELSAEASGSVTDRTGVDHLEGTYFYAGYSPTGPRLFLVDAHVRVKGEDQTRHVVVGGNGMRYFLIDHDKKIVYAGATARVLGSAARWFVIGLFAEFVHPEPFSDEIAGTKHELAGDKTVGDVECYEIHVEYAKPDAPKTTWFISKADYLPRGRIDTYETSGGTGHAARTLRKLVVNPEVVEEDFQVKIPEGYTLSHDFAP